MLLEKRVKKNISTACLMANAVSITEKGKYIADILIKTTTYRELINNRIYHLGILDSEKSVKKNPELVYYKEGKAVTVFG